MVVGRTWVDSFGDYSLFNATTGAKAEMYFTPCGWFDSGHYEVGFWEFSTSNHTDSAVTVTPASFTSPVPVVVVGSFWWEKLYWRPPAATGAKVEVDFTF